jgi:Peptidase propeptide and YPEB domain
MDLRRNKSTSIAAVLLTGALVALAPAAARPGAGAGAQPVEIAFGTLAGVSMDQAIQMAERQYGAKVVRASVSEDNGRRVYVLRLVSEQGRVWTVRVDAASGAMM